MKTTLTTVFALALLFYTNLTAQTPGTWTVRTPMPEIVQETVPTVYNGKIYFAGGIDANGIVSNSLRIYDPSTDKWSFGATLPKRVHHNGITALNGKIYVLGGYTTKPGDDSAWYSPTSYLQIYDVATNTWTWNPNDSLPVARGGYDIGYAYNGEIYIIGGIDAVSNGSQRVDIYNPTTKTWSLGANLPTPRDHPEGTILDSLLLVVGGAGADSNLTTVEGYSPATNKWYTLPPMPTGRHAASVGVINGKLYVIGGEANEGIRFSRANEEYNPATRTWREMTPDPIPRSHTGGAVVGNLLYVIGGSADTSQGAVMPFFTTNVNHVFSPSGIAAVSEPPMAAPYEFALNQNYPNPFNPSTTIEFSLAHSQKVTLKIYNLLGQEVGTLLKGEVTAGNHTFKFDAEALNSGVYFYRLQAGEGTLTKRMVLLK